jgi:hypothetical protein
MPNFDCEFEAELLKILFVTPLEVAYTDVLQPTNFV